MHHHGSFWRLFCGGHFLVGGVSLDQRVEIYRPVMTTRWTNQWFRHTTIFFLCVTVLVKFLAEYQATTFFFPAVGTKAKKMVVVISWNVHCVPVAGGCSENHVRTVAKYAARLAKQHDA